MIVNVKDIPVAYEIRGRGRPILMIHGWSPDHRLMTGCMEPVFTGEQSGWQRIYFNLPGMGQTPGAPWIDGSDAMLDLVMGFIDAVLPDKRFALAGESYGGYLARGILKKRPESVDGLLLICPVADQNTRLKNAPEFQIIEQDEAFVNSLSEEERGYLAGIAVRQTPWAFEKFTKDVLPGLKAADYEFLEQNLAQHVSFSFDPDQLDRPFLRPSLMVMGRQDNMVGYRDQWDIIENFPRSSFVVLDKSGHNLQFEQEEIFHALVGEWLQRVQSEVSI